MNSGLIVANIDKSISANLQFFQNFLSRYIIVDTDLEIEITCMINKINNKKQEVRISIQETRWGKSYYGGTIKEGVRTIYDEKICQDFLNQIPVEVKQKEALKR